MSDGVKHTYALFSAHYYPHAGGVESFTQRLAHELMATGNRVFIVTSQLDSSSPEHEVQGDGVEVYRLPAWTFLEGRLPISRRNAAYKETLSRLSSVGIDRVLVNCRFYRHSLEGVRFAKRLGVPVVVLDHGSAHLTIGNRFVDWFVKGYEHVVTWRIKGLAPNFAGISKASIHWLEHFDIQTFAVIPNAIDVEAFQSNASGRSFRAEFGCRNEQTLVAFVGRLEKEKGALELVKAMRQLGDEYVCVMAGDGRLRQRIASLNIENVILVGRLEQSDLSALLKEVDVFCLPTRSEGFCTALLEAGAQGANPVMPHVGGTDEVMGYNPSRFGVILEKADSRSVAEGIRLATNPRKSDRNAIKDFVQKSCSWQKTVQALEEVFSVLQL